MFGKKTVKDIDLSGKRVLLRADYNVSVKDGKVINDYRLTQSIPTIEYIWQQYQSSIMIVSHLGRPEGKPDKAYSLEPVARHLSKLLGKEVKFVSNCIGEDAQKACAELGPGQILMLENVRFHPEEEADDKIFAEEIVKTTGAEIFVQDGFGVVHRAHATTHAIAKLLPAVAGLLLEAEVGTITKVMKEPERPLLAIVGGAKISDKIEVLREFIDLADTVAVVGAMANNFLSAEGSGVGKSLVEPGVLGVTEEIIKKARQAEKNRKFNFVLPVDAVTSVDIKGRKATRVVDLSGHFLADVHSYPRVPAKKSYSLEADELILDIGPSSAGVIAGAIKMAKTVVWNGTCGVTETKGIAGAENPFAHGTRTIVEAMTSEGNNYANRPFTLVGGGDTAGYVEQEGLLDEFSHVSTGGGASLELMSGKKLPGVEVLEDK